MNLPELEQSRKNEQGPLGEIIRLHNELLPIQAHQITRKISNHFGKEETKTFNIPARLGFDDRTAPYKRFVEWLSDTTIKKSESLFWHVIRTMARRFEDKHTDIKTRLHPKHHTEFELILSEMKNEDEWAGTVGINGMVRLDGSLSDPRNKPIKLRDGSFKIVRK